MLFSLMATGAYPPRDGRRGPPPDPDPSASALGMWVFLLSLGVFFAAMFVLYLVFRSWGEVWPPPGMPAWPKLFWLSTLLLLGASAALHWALRCVRHDGIVMMQRSLVLAGILATGFLVCQVVCWNEFFRWEFSAADRWRLAAFFYFLMILHAAHVVGGGVALWIVLRNSLRGRYSRHHHHPVRNCTMYWHFLDVVWLCMLAAMVF